jgi:hypothetical protein
LTYLSEIQRKLCEGEEARDPKEENETGDNRETRYGVFMDDEACGKEQTTA